jgi:hypothetical protein
MVVMPPKNCECCHGQIDREYYSLTHVRLVLGVYNAEGPVLYFCSEPCVTNYLNRKC